METLKVTKREANEKGNQLRREGLIPAVIYGKNLDNSISIKIDEHDLSKFLKNNTVGSQAELKVDRKKMSVILKTLDRVPMSNAVQHLDFQVLTEGEKLKVSTKIHFINKDKVEPNSIVNGLLHEIDLECLPKDLVDEIEVDLSGLKIGDAILVSDLDVSKSDKYHVITASDATVVSVTAPQENASEPVEEDAGITVPVIGDKNEDA